MEFSLMLLNFDFEYFFNGCELLLNGFGGDLKRLFLFNEIVIKFFDLRLK
jgi:hypothetical protein